MIQQWTTFLRKIFSRPVLSGYVHAIQRKYKEIHLGRVVFFAGAGASLVVVLFVAAHLMWALALPIPAFGQLENGYIEESTKMYDRSGNVLLYDTKGSMRQTVVSLDDISPYLIDATVAIEDHGFYEHNGIQPSAILRAFLVNAETLSASQGGSTITQQMVKNTLLTKDKKLIRKLKEWVLATRIERKYTKNEILETYLNETPYGGTIYGVEEASRAYFNKSAKDLTLSEAAYLSALPKAPTYLSPRGENRDALTKRRNLVLERMHAQNLISDDEYVEALAEDVVFAKRETESIKAPHFVFYVLKELEKKYGKEVVYEGQLEIITTLDWELQKESEKIIREGALENEKNFQASNAGLVAIDPKSGQVLAMVGSRDYFDDSVDGQVNVTLAHRQPGSTFKPFAYAAAFKKGYSPETMIYDLKTQFSTACMPSNLSNEYPCYSPDNYDSEFRGPMSMRDALAQSVNVVGVKTLYLAGMEETIDTARSLGITTITDTDRYGLTLVLGGGEVTLLEMTVAYGALANEGTRYNTASILSAKNANGKILETYSGKPVQSIDKRVAMTINDILSDNEARTPAFGSNSPLHFKGVDVASKTGTTNDYRDAWVIGYTPSIVVGTWAGNNDNSPMGKKVSSYILAPMWHEAMDKAIARFPSQPFGTPQKSSAFLPSPPTDPLDADFLSSAHEILFFAKKDDPRAGAPANPYADPQLALWDYPVRLWANKQVALSATTSDMRADGMFSSVDELEGGPMQLLVAASGGGSNVSTNEPFTVEIDYSGKEEIMRVNYYLNGKNIGSTNISPFSIYITPKGEEELVVRAVAETPLGGREASVVITASGNSLLTTNTEQPSGISH